MDKINLFVILAFKEQTYKYMDVLDKMSVQYDENIKEMETTLSWHYFMLSKYFNVYNFYEYENTLNEFANAVIYHLPFGKDNIESGVEELLLKFKGKTPIVMRSYDAHSPLKTSKVYMETYHDLILTYLMSHVNNKNILFANMSFDNHLVYQYNSIPKKRKLACMILRRETRSEYHENTENFKNNNLDLEKIYGLREDIVKYTKIDIYGKNWSYQMTNYKGPLYPHIKKYTTLNEYKFNIIIENVVVNNFLSEKVFDSFVSLSVPVYFGSPQVDEWIPKSCYVDFRDFETNDELISYLENMEDFEYINYVNSIKSHKMKLFNKFSSKLNFAIPLYKWYQENYNNKLSYTVKDFYLEESNVSNLIFVNKVTLKRKVKNLLIWLYVNLRVFK
jgi:hypothetical protein